MTPPDLVVARAFTPTAIRALRKRYGLTQRQLERVLGLGPKTVVRWESGKVLPNRATDTLLALIDRDPSALQFLAERHEVDVGETPSSATLARRARALARQSIRVRTLPQSDDAAGADPATLTPAERVGMMWPLARSAWAFRGATPHAESGVSRHAVRIQRRGR